ncbi:MAG: hypothetical protein Q9191_000280 [Dirinaria sp. TL-2023a]
MVGAMPRVNDAMFNKDQATRMLPTSRNGPHSSSLLKLQADELLETLRHEYDQKAQSVENTLRRLKAIIESIEGHEQLPVLDAESRLHNISGTRIPFPGPRPGKETKYLLAYAKPANINVVGSYARKTAIRVDDRLTIDMAVTMPSTLFQDKDYLNYRYFHKRAYYLAYLASGIKNTHELAYSTNYAFQNDNPLQPVVLVEPFSGNHGDAQPNKSKYQIRIIIAASGDLFPLTRTLPGKNCIRFQKVASAIDKADSTTPTPLYNATLRSECCTLSSLKLVHAASTQSEAFGDACLLGSVWLRQRGMGTGLSVGGFGPFEWAYLLAVLLQGGGLNGKPALSRGYSSLQLFKATLQFLSARDLVANPLVMQVSNTEVAGNDSGPTVFDGLHGINVLFKMTISSYNKLRHEANITLQALRAPLMDQFESTFVTRTDFLHQQFDMILRQDQRFREQVYGLLKQGLGDRIYLAYPWTTKRHVWSTDLSTHQNPEDRNILVGLLFRPDQAFRAVDHGPATEDKEKAAAYRQFWGEKAELRRFRNGSMLETLIWTRDSELSIIEQILRYIISRHLGQEFLDGLEIFGDMFGHFLSDPGPLNPAPPITTALENMEKEIRNTDGLPLQVRQVSATGAELRYAAVKRGPNSQPLARRQSEPPADVCVQFEDSARWPNDIAAVQRTKIAFLMKMGELLEQNTRDLTARVGLENQSHELLNNAFLDVVYPHDSAFRVRIHHERELSMLESALKDKTAEMGPREEIMLATAAYKRTFVQAQLHTQAVRTLCTRHPLLSPSMRLMKRWRDSHLLSGHISDELIELVTIRTFILPYPYQAPGSLSTAFFRTLAFISKWDWRHEPLIVDFNDSMTSQAIDAIRLRFEAWRKIDPAMNRVIMLAASNHDPDGITWTVHNPSKVVAARFTELARAATDLANEQGLQTQPDILFTPSTAEYDFVIHLHPKFSARSLDADQKKPAFKNLQMQGIEDVSLVGYSPMKLYVEELRSRYGNDVLFFSDETEGSVIAGLWNPQTRRRPWKVNIPYSTMPMMEDGEENITINKPATLHDIAKLGGDLVTRIEMR